jgi:hypothetical protein
MRRGLPPLGGYMRRRLAAPRPIPPVAAYPLGNSVGAIESVARHLGSPGASGARGWARSVVALPNGNANVRLPPGGLTLRFGVGSG